MNWWGIEETEPVKFVPKHKPIFELDENGEPTGRVLIHPEDAHLFRGCEITDGDGNPIPRTLLDRIR